MTHDNIEKHQSDTNAILLSIVLLGIIFHYLNPILKPLLIAIFLYYITRPVVFLLSKMHIPIVGSYLLLLGLLTFIFFILEATVFNSISLLQTKIPEYQSVFQQRVEFLKANDIGQFLIHVGSDMLNESNTSKWFAWLLETVLGFLKSFAVVLFYLLFIIFGASKLPQRLQKAFTKETSQKVMHVSGSINQCIQKYLLIKTVISLGTAITSGIVMYFFGIDFWLLWTIVIFIANYVPYVGSAIACCFPIAMGFLQNVELYSLLTLIALLLSTQILWGNVLEPYIAGKHLSINPLILLFLLAYWGWLWGTAGMFLAYPLAIITRTVLDNFDETKPIATLIS
ncbi:AI-2E family transporter [Candidatus Uabimicrobium amorphum]|uniref:Membrane protein n=1 Tax=Uabimicrobium amorphum TaxID=2596890 RepID=A0A5S9IU69_UABAM|nr:AI-2E family transporter [Candidatus Uabimicrobium amorphum]BBM88218.1 membrane protein [Candidatus Uabimicrobium amorphum]